MAQPKRTDAFAALPDPGTARSLDELTERLRRLKTWAANPSYEVITARVNAQWVATGRPDGELARRGTVVDCFKIGRRRLNVELVAAVVQALHPDPGYVAEWVQALRVVLGETQAAVQVRAVDSLPPDLAEFSGRAAELDRLRRTLNRETGGAGGIAAIEGMAGVGKTRLAVHAGHVLGRTHPFDHVLFVDLRGFHPDPTRRPADPNAVLDSFLRLLGVPGQQIPPDLAGRVALFRRRVAGRRALVVLDNAADEDQVRPLLADGAHCLTLITSRRSLTGLRVDTRLTVDPLTPDEALELLQRAASDVPIGDDPDALPRIVGRTGRLPLALGLVAAQMRTTPGWTVTDHADRLDERHHLRRLDVGVELALSLSYQHLPPHRKQLFRLLAVHPGHDFDAYAAAAIANCDPATADEHLRRLCEEHLLQPGTPGRYTFHDLVRTYAAERLADEVRPVERREALIRMLDHYLYAAAAAAHILYPAERDRQLRSPTPSTPIPPIPDLTTARTWLDTECANLITAAICAADEPRSGHTARLAAVLYRYLDAVCRYTDAVGLHTRAWQAARDCGDTTAEARALTDLGIVYWRLGDYQRATDRFDRAMSLFVVLDDRYGQARVLTNLGLVNYSSGHQQRAADLHRQALTRFRELGDRNGEGRALQNLAVVHERVGDDELAAENYRQSRAVFAEIGDRRGEASALLGLGDVDLRLGRHGRAQDDFRRSLALFRETGDLSGEAAALTGVGRVYEGTGRYGEAVDHLRQAITICGEVDIPGVEVEARNLLGGILLATGRPDDARIEYAAALVLADQIDDRSQGACARDGLARVQDG